MKRFATALLFAAYVYAEDDPVDEAKEGAEGTWEDVKSWWSTK